MTLRAGWLLLLAFCALAGPGGWALAKSADAPPLLSPNLNPPFHGTLQLPFGAPLKKPVKGFALSSLARVKVSRRGVMVSDYENLRFSWQGPTPCPRRWRCDLHLGFDHQAAGFLDGFVEDYHRNFGWPEGDRPALPVNTYTFGVTGGGAMLAGGASPRDSFTNPVWRGVRPRAGGEAVVAVSLPLATARDSVTGKVAGLAVGWQKRHPHRRVSLVGVGISGGHALTGQLPVQWHWQGQLTLAPPTIKKRRHWWTFFAQGVPVKGSRARFFNQPGLLLQVDMQLRPGGQGLLRFTEDLQNAQDFSLGYYWY